jgi:calpain-15
MYRGKWMTIDLDDFIPYMYEFPAFSSAAKDELWVILLEKAWAKLYGSFKRIEAGFPE